MSTQMDSRCASCTSFFQPVSAEPPTPPVLPLSPGRTSPMLINNFTTQTGTMDLQTTMMKMPPLTVTFSTPVNMPIIG